MPIVRAEHTRDYTQVINDINRDDNISYGAKGLMLRVLSYPDNWEFSNEDFFITKHDKKTKVRGYLKELQDNNYLKRTMTRNERGIIVGSRYVFHERPFSENPNLENLKMDEQIENKEIEPFSEKPFLDNPNLDNPFLENLKDNNTNILNKTNIYIVILEHWNAKKIITHKMSDSIEKALKAVLKKHSKDVIIQSIDRYAEAYFSDFFYYDHKWTLEKFLKQSNGVPNYFDDGAIWLNYLKDKDKQQTAKQGPAAKDNSDYEYLIGG